MTYNGIGVRVKFVLGRKIDLTHIFKIIRMVRRPFIVIACRCWSSLEDASLSKYQEKEKEGMNEALSHGGGCDQNVKPVRNVLGLSGKPV